MAYGRTSKGEHYQRNEINDGAVFSDTTQEYGGRISVPEGFGPAGLYTVAIHKLFDAGLNAETEAEQLMQLRSIVNSNGILWLADVFDAILEAEQSLDLPRDYQHVHEELDQLRGLIKNTLTKTEKRHFSRVLERLQGTPRLPAFNDDGYESGSGILVDIGKFFTGSYPGEKLVKSFLSQYSSVPVTSISVYRNPLPLLSAAGDVLTEGKLDAASKKYGYDKLFHLYMVVNNKFLIEKNQTVKVGTVLPGKNTETESIDIPLAPGITIGTLLNNGLKKLGEKNFYVYDAFSKNCQDFIWNILTANNLGNDSAKQFILQNAAGIGEQLPSWIRGLATVGTDLAALYNQFKNRKRQQGSGIMASRIPGFDNFIAEMKKHPYLYGPRSDAIGPILRPKIALMKGGQLDEIPSRFRSHLWKQALYELEDNGWNPKDSVHKRLNALEKIIERKGIDWVVQKQAFLLAFHRSPGELLIHDLSFFREDEDEFLDESGDGLKKRRSRRVAGGKLSNGPIYNAFIKAGIDPKKLVTTGPVRPPTNILRGRGVNADGSVDFKAYLPNLPGMEFAVEGSGIRKKKDWTHDIKTKKGVLGRYGYKVAIDGMVIPDKLRRAALKKAIDHMSTATLLKRLNFLANVNSKKREIYHAVRDDIQFVEENTGVLLNSLPRKKSKARKY